MSLEMGELASMDNFGLFLGAQFPRAMIRTSVFEYPDNVSKEVMTDIIVVDFVFREREIQANLRRKLLSSSYRLKSLNNLCL